jgi:hypothetical protein
MKVVSSSFFSGNCTQAAGSRFGLHGKSKTRPANVQKQPLGPKQPSGENHEVPSMFTGSLVQEKVPYY